MTSLHAQAIAAARAELARLEAEQARVTLECMRARALLGALLGLTEAEAKALLNGKPSTPQ